jgi:hypothetical protein
MNTLENNIREDYYYLYSRVATKEQIENMVQIDLHLRSLHYSRINLYTATNKIVNKDAVELAMKGYTAETFKLEQYKNLPIEWVVSLLTD